MIISGAIAEHESFHRSHSNIRLFDRRNRLDSALLLSYRRAVEENCRRDLWRHYWPGQARGKCEKLRGPKSLANVFYYGMAGAVRRAIWLFLQGFYRGNWLWVAPGFYWPAGRRI